MKPIRSLSRALLLISFICFSFSVFAQTFTPVLKHYTGANGLTGTEVYHALADSNGFLWFGTNRGISCFNGTYFTNYPIDKVLPNSSVLKLCLDETGRIWFITFSGHVGYLKDKIVYPYKFNKELEKKVIGAKVLVSFYANEQDSVAVGYNEGYCFVAPNGRVTSVESNSKNVLVEINKYKESFTANFYKLGLKHNKKNFIIEFNYPLKRKVNAYYASNWTTHFQFIVRHNGSFLLALGNLYEISQNQLTVSDSSYEIVSVCEDKEGDLWLGLFKKGVRYIGKDINNKVILGFLYNKTITAIVEDLEGGLWFTTLEDGIYYMPSKHVMNFYPKSSDNNRNCNALSADSVSKRIFFGFENGNIFEFNKNKITEFNQNEKLFPTSFFTTLDYNHYNEKLYLSNGMYTGNIKTNKDGSFKAEELKFNNNIIQGVKQFYFVDHAEYWIAHASMAAHFINEEYVFSTSKFGFQFRSSSFIKYQNKILAANLNGLWALDTNYAITRFSPNDSLFYNGVSFLTELEKGVFAACIYGKGLYVYSENKKYLISTENGLPSNDIKHVYRKNDSLWLATNKGIALIKMNDLLNEQYEVYRFSATNGLISDEVKRVAAIDGIVYAATRDGLLMFDPKKIDNVKEKPKVIFAGARIQSRDTVLLSNYTNLSSSINSLSFKYVVQSYRSNKNYTYEYYLIKDNATPIWVKNEITQVDFVGLNPGRYTFAVRAVDAINGIYGIPSVISFEINKPIWLTWYAFVFYFLLATIFLVLIIQSRYKRKLLHQQQQIEKALLEAKALRAQMNPHFMFNALNSIQAFIATNNNKQAVYYLAKFARLMRMVLDNSKRSLITLEQEVQVLYNYLELEKMRFNNSFTFEIIADSIVDKSAVKLPPMLIQPFIENAILHGVSKSKHAGIINVVFKIENEYLYCLIDDNGIGRKASAQYKSDLHVSSGVGITEDRLNLMSKGEKIGIRFMDKTDESGLECGTSVELKIPLK